MTDHSGIFRRLEDFFAKAAVWDRYAHYDSLTAMNRLRARVSPIGAYPKQRNAYHGQPTAAHRSFQPEQWLAPTQDHLVDAEVAWRNLNAATTAVLSTTDATHELTRFINSNHTCEDGALLFACLLYLAEHEEGARFWWQFAAGAGSTPAAYCLFLDHARLGEYHDAETWACTLNRQDFIPEHLWGKRTMSPLPAVPKALLEHVLEKEHEDLGTITLPRHTLPAAVHQVIEHTPAVASTWEDRHPTTNHQNTYDTLQNTRPPTTSPPSPADGQPHTAQAQPELPWSKLSLRHPSLTSAAQQAVTAHQGEALAKAQRALAVVQILDHHRLGVDATQIARECATTEQELRPILTLLCEEEYAQQLNDTVYTPGPALHRLDTPGDSGIALQLQHQLVRARDDIGAAIYLSRYIDGEVHITQVADGPLTPGVNEWVDFRSAAHASAVGKCLLTQLDHNSRADHFARHKTPRLTSRTITSQHRLLNELDRLAPNEPVYDLREYSPSVVCSAVPLTTGTQAGSLALSLPLTNADRLQTATETLARKAIPILLALLLTGTLPPDPSHLSNSLLDAVNTAITADTVNRLRRRFRKPLTTAKAIAHAAYSSTPEPHLANDTTDATLYLFDPAPTPTSLTSQPPLALPHAYPDPHPTAGQTNTHAYTRHDSAHTPDLLVFST